MLAYSLKFELGDEAFDGATNLLRSTATCRDPNPRVWVLKLK